MRSEFHELSYHWTIKEGSPPMMSIETTSPSFGDALRTACSSLAKTTSIELGSWVLGRLWYLTSGTLASEGEAFTHDDYAFGYLITIANKEKLQIASGTVMFHSDRVCFSGDSRCVASFQETLVQLLSESPNDLMKFTIRVRQMDSGQKRVYGWDGHNLQK